MRHLSQDTRDMCRMSSPLLAATILSQCLSCASLSSRPFAREAASRVAFLLAADLSRIGVTHRNLSSRTLFRSAMSDHPRRIGFTQARVPNRDGSSLVAKRFTDVPAVAKE